MDGQWMFVPKLEDGWHVRSLESQLEKNVRRLELIPLALLLSCHRLIETHKFS